MNTFTKKSLHVALAGLGTLGLVGAADAVMVNPNGLGQVLIYPYYTVRSPAGAGVANYNTLLSIVNTTSSQKAVKVRFREGKASKEVLDFNVFLSPYDMWTASLEPAGGAAGGVKLFTNDTSCTIPKIPATGVDFRNSRYIGDGAADNSLARLREGYFEVIEMATYTDGSVIAKNSKHTSSRVPKDCSLVTDDAAYEEQRLPQGGLTGTASLVSPGSGLNAATDPTVLVNFKFGANYQDTGQIAPDMSDADTFSTTADGFGNAILANWTLGEDAVSAALM